MALRDGPCCQDRPDACKDQARLASARRIIAVDIFDRKLESARHFGATDTVNAAHGDPVAAIRELTNGGVDYSFEAIGSK